MSTNIGLVPLNNVDLSNRPDRWLLLGKRREQESGETFFGNNSSVNVLIPYKYRAFEKV